MMLLFNPLNYQTQTDNAVSDFLRAFCKPSVRQRTQA